MCKYLTIFGYRFGIAATSNLCLVVFTRHAFRFRCNRIDDFGWYSKDRYWVYGSFSKNAMCDPDQGEPSAWEIDSSSGNIDQNIKPGGALDNSNNCAAGCDLIYALQWDLGLLGPGEISTVTIGLSDDGRAISANFLDANSLSDSASLRLSGTTVIPLPAALPLFLSAILGLGVFTRRKRVEHFFAGT